MDADNIVKFPDELEILAKEFRATLADDEVDHEKWIARKLKQADILATARARCASNAAFGQWCSAQRFGENILSKNERAILIQWGEKPDWTRTVLEKTKRKSIQHIHANEWCLTRVSNTPKAKPPGGPKLQAAKAYAQVYEADHQRFPPETLVAHDTGVSRGIAADALRDLKSRRAEEDGRIRFTKADDRHLEARLRMLDKAREADFNERVRLGVLARNADYLKGLKELEQEARTQLELYETLVNRHQPVFTETEFITILTCLHPDNSASKEKRNIAFKAFNAMKFQLTGKR